jgi:hypothetical protein
MVIVPPLIMLAIEWIALKISDRVYMGVHFFFVAAIATFLFFQFQKNTGLPTFLIVVIGVGLGVLFAYALFRSAFLKNLMDILIAAPIVVLVMFVFFSNANKLIFPDSDKVELAQPSADNLKCLVILTSWHNGLMTDTKTVDAHGARTSRSWRRHPPGTRTSRHLLHATRRARILPARTVMTRCRPRPTSRQHLHSSRTTSSMSWAGHGYPKPLPRVAGTRQLRRLRPRLDLKYVRSPRAPRIADTLPTGNQLRGLRQRQRRRGFSSTKEAQFVKAVVRFRPANTSLHQDDPEPTKASR